MNNRLREMRKAKKMTQKDLADAIGVTRETISIIENGRFNPSLPVAFKIARVLGEPIEEIFSLEDEDWESKA